MTTPPTEKSAYTIELDERRSQRFLEQATRAGAEMGILPYTRVDGLPITAAIVGRTAQGILLRPQHTVAAGAVSLLSVYCEATITLEKTRFLFSTHILDLFQEGDEFTIEIARPTRLYMSQRRRYQRRDLRADSTVRITPAGREDQPALEATLLNIGTGGLACRIDQSGADACPEELPLSLEFNIADSAETFRMPAHIRGKTPGAGKGQIILSLQFASDTDLHPQRQRLANALYNNLILTGG
ncbi:MAG: PilZ domain-containing protein [Phycisphaerae bacterium]|nr:PilZ domain-containing protein [Phycisphaerae bacterium]